MNKVKVVDDEIVRSMIHPRIRDNSLRPLTLRDIKFLPREELLALLLVREQVFSKYMKLYADALKLICIVDNAFGRYDSKMDLVPELKNAKLRVINWVRKNYNALNYLPVELGGTGLKWEGVEK